MSVVFRPLFTAEVNHAYYGGPCGDLEFLIPATTARVLSSLRLLARVRENRLHLLYEAASSGGNVPRVSPTGVSLVFGLRLVNPWFTNITAPVVAGSASSVFYANTADPTKLDAPRGVTLAAGLFRYTTKAAARPLTVRLLSGAVPVEVRTLSPGDPTALFDLRALPEGFYRVDENAGAGPVAATDLYVSDALLALGVWGVLQVKVSPGFAAAPAAFTMSFQARSQPLSYYVVADNFTQAELDQLSVTDGGAADEQRPAIAFDRIPQANFGPGDLAPTLLGAPPARLVLFRSQAPVARRSRGYGKLRLNRNGDAVVDNLPLPRPDRPTADLVVHVSKPI